MSLQHLTAWIFAALILMVALLFIWPSPTFGLLSMGLLGVVAVLQTYLVLRSKENSEKTFSEGHWYEDHHAPRSSDKSQ